MTLKYASNLLMLAALTAGCASSASTGPLTPHAREKDFQQRRVAAANVAGPEASQISTYMKLLRVLRVRAAEEATPNGVPRTALLDDASIATLTAAETCLAVTLRTGDELDLPLGSVGFEINGVPAMLRTEAEAVAKTYPYVALVETKHAEAQGPLGAGFVGVREQTQRTLVVTERSGVVCATVGFARGRLELVVRNRQGSEVGGYGAAFLWRRD